MKAFLLTIWRSLSLPKHIQLWFMRLREDKFLVGVTGLVFNDEGKVLLFKHTYRSRQWGLPGGYVKGREHPKEALEREIEEESGLFVSVDREVHIRTDRESSRLDVVVEGAFVGGEFTPSAEVVGYGFFAFNELPLLSKSQLLLVKEAFDKHSIPTQYEQQKPSEVKRLLLNIKRNFLNS